VPGAAGLKPHHLEELLLLLRFQKLLFCKQVFDYEFLHAPLASENLFLLCPDGIPIWLRRGDQVNQFSPEAVHLVALDARGFLELHQARLDLAPLRLGRAEPAVERTPDAFFMRRTAPAAQMRGDRMCRPDNDEGYVERDG
jgi:hypothetical protein